MLHSSLCQKCRFFHNNCDVKRRPLHHSFLSISINQPLSLISWACKSSISSNHHHMLLPPVHDTCQQIYSPPSPFLPATLMPSHPSFHWNEPLIFFTFDHICCSLSNFYQHPFPIHQFSSSLNAICAPPMPPLPCHCSWNPSFHPKKPAIIPYTVHGPSDMLSLPLHRGMNCRYFSAITSVIIYWANITNFLPKYNPSMFLAATCMLYLISVTHHHFLLTIFYLPKKCMH